MNTIWRAMLVIGVSLVMMAGCASSGGDAPTTEAPIAAEASQPVEPEAPAQEPLANTLKWTTASEVDNFGFDIYRALAEDGPYERITAEPLAGAGTTDEPQKYVFIDEDIDPTRDYYYYIESITLGGIREIFSPKIKAPAKITAGEAKD